MPAVQDIALERDHYEKLFRRDGDHSFIAEGHARIHDQTVGRLPLGSSILDMGSATGLHSREFAHRGFRVSGVELSPTAVEICRKSFAESGLPGEFICGDVRSLPYPDRSFDAAFLSLVLHHFPDQDRVLAEAARVSRDYLFVFEPNAWNPQSFLLLNVLNPIFSPSFLTRNQRAVDPRRLRRVLEPLGFECQATTFLTLASTGKKPRVRRLIYAVQRILPRGIRHNKFVQVYRRRA